MASDTVRPSQATPRRRWRRPLLAAIGLLFVLSAFFGWLFGSASGARAAFSAIASLSAGMVQAQGTSGRLAGPLRIDKLTLRQSGSSETLHDVRLDWYPTALLHGVLHVDYLHVESLGITIRIDKEPEPLELPEHLALPFALQVDEVQVKSGEINRGPVNLIKLGPFAFRLTFDDDNYQLDLRRFAAASSLEQGNIATTFSGQARLSAHKPYPLSASIASKGSATIEQQAFGASGQIKLDGTLAELTAALDLAVNKATITGRATLRPFSEQVLGAAQLRAEALDLANLKPSLPHSALDLALTAAEDGSGELLVKNSLSGTIDAQKLPLSSFSLTFRQSDGQFQFDRIRAQLGSPSAPAGDVTGSGRYAAGMLSLSLHTDALDAQRLDRRVRATSLAGQLTIRHAAGKQDITLSLSEPLQQQRIMLDAHGVLADDELTLDRAELQAGNAHVVASGRMALVGRQSFRAQGKVSHFRLQEFGTFPKLPELDLNGDFSLRGARQPQLEADFAFDIADSRLAGEPLSGEGRAQLRGERLLVPGLRLASGANRMDLQGQLASGDSQLAFVLDAPQMAQFGTALSGALKVNGTVRGSMTKPRINAEWNASNARLPAGIQIDAMQGKAEVALDRSRPFILDTLEADLSARGLRQGTDQTASLSVQARFAPQADAPLVLTVLADSIVAGQVRAERISMNANGTTAQHAIDAALTEQGQAWTIKANGGLSDLAKNVRWQGNVTGFDAKGRINARLASPAALLVSKLRVQLDRFVLDADAGRIALDQFARDADGILMRGRLERLQLAQLMRYIDTDVHLETDLQLSGEWDVRIADTLSGTIAMRRERGDVTVLGGTPVTLGLRNLSANANASGGRLVLQVQADGERLGRIALSANTIAGSGPNRLVIAPDAPVGGSARIDVPSLAWIAPLLPPSVIVDGRLHSDIALGGSVSEPRFSGNIGGEALRLSLTDLGVDLRDGVLDSEFQGDRLQLKNLVFRGGEGKLSLSGPIDLGGGRVATDLTLRAEHFALLNRADRRIVLSGDSHIGLRERQATVSGEFTVDSGLIDLGHEDKPRLSSDVVIAGRKQKQAEKSAANVDITIELADSVTLRGRGIDAQLGGKIRISGDPGEAPQANGTLKVTKGTFDAYGRELTIEQGLLRFTGAIGNPAMDIRAMRRGQEVAAGVSVRGTVLAPRVTLVSEPNVPDVEKLSWLVLGRGLSTGSGTGSGSESDADALQSAAAALLAEGAKAGMQTGIASAFGLDTFSVGTRQGQDNLQDRIVTVGKRVSQRVYIGYQQSLESVGSVLQLRYILSPKLTVEAEVGTRSALSMFYNFAFD